MPWTPQTLIAAASCPDSCIPTGMQTAAVIVQFMEAAGMTNADIKALMAKAACVDSCIPRGMQTAVLISLIQTVSGDTSTPAQLMERAKCLYGCIPTGMLMPVLTALGAAGPGGDCDFQEGIGSPVGVATPDFVGQLYHDTVADAYYRSTGLTNADWTLIAGGGGGDGLVWGPNATTLDSIDLFMPTFGDLETTYSFPTLAAVTANLNCNGLPTVTELLFPALTTIGGSVNISGDTALTTFDVPVLTSLTGDFNSTNNPALTTLDLSALTTLGGVFTAENDTLLTAVNLSSVMTLGGFYVVNDPVLTALDLSAATTLTFIGSAVGNNALTTIDLSALTNSAAGLTITTNPLLTSFLCGAWVPGDGTTQNFSGCALTATSVELILRRCVLAGVTTCTIDLSGGTNAGTASLNAQGQADVVTLGGQLTINP